ncbi:MAG: polysaccharide biosynthesis protein [Bacteroidales bacterium]|nr:polysaccharide biosynthesis protein [Bacteroidales bacterium]
MEDTSRAAPRAVILIIDVAMIFFSTMIAYLLRFNFNIPADQMELIPLAVTIFLVVRVASFAIAKTFTGIIQYTETQDVMRILSTLLVGTLIISIIDYVYYFTYDSILIPRAILIIEFISSSIGLISFRLLIKTTYSEFKSPRMNGGNGKKVNIIIFGAGEGGIFTYNALKQSYGDTVDVKAFIDDSSSKQGRKLMGVKVYKPFALEDLLEESHIDKLIISAQTVSVERKNLLAEICLKHKTKIQYVPPVSNWINGELSTNQIKDINILELLERSEINLDRRAISKELNDKVIWITGGAGSIGSEIIRQVSKFKPRMIVVIDAAETPMYHIELELQSHITNNIEFMIGDVRSRARMKKAFKHYSPDIIYHAAAYKHVPLMESNPSEAIMTNVKGTRVLADLANEFGVEKFIMISTDKAVNPTNVMGASKRIAETYVQALNEKSKTKYITTRFGNVLGSNGSVIPLFTKQIREGGPLTITHPDITRYFMTIPEACQLVLEAGNKGHGGEIFVFNMGESVKILDLAKKMIKLSGLEVGKDIQIIFTGLRPGEKLYEELLATEENTLPTDHEKIMIAEVRAYDYDKINGEIQNLINLFDTQNNLEIVKEMKAIVPEFKSKNSVYEGLDNH